MKTLPAAAVEEKNKLEGSATIHLFELEHAAGQYLRYTDYSEDVVFDGNTFFAKPMQLGERTESSEGEAEVMDIVVGNVAGEVEYIFEATDMSEKPGTLWTVAANLTGNPANALDETFEVGAAFFNRPLATIRLVMQPDILSVRIPTETFNRNEFPGLPSGRAIHVS